MARINYVCVTCSQHFTRRYSGIRHSFKTHDGRSEIVRLLDYIIGRASGKYNPSHPSSYKREQKFQNPFRDNQDRNFRRSVIADSIGDKFRYANFRDVRSSASTYNTPNYTSPPTSPQSAKIQELRALLAKYPAFLAQTPNQIISWAIYRCSNGDDSFLEEKLAQFRMLDRMQQ